jgi:hypothetical protein
MVKRNLGKKTENFIGSRTSIDFSCSIRFASLSSLPIPLSLSHSFSFSNACCDVPRIVYAALRLLPDNDSRKLAVTSEGGGNRARNVVAPTCAPKEPRWKSLTGYDRATIWQISLPDLAELSSSVYISHRDIAKRKESEGRRKLTYTWETVPEILLYRISRLFGSPELQEYTLTGNH